MVKYLSFQSQIANLKLKKKVSNRITNSKLKNKSDQLDD